MAEPNRYGVVWSEPASSDLQNLIEFIAARNPSDARTILDSIRKQAGTLAHFPRRGRVVPELKAIGLETYRELILFPYRLLFRIKGNQVFVLGLFDGRRDMEEVIFERLTRLH